MAYLGKKLNLLRINFREQFLLLCPVYECPEGIWLGTDGSKILTDKELKDPAEFVCTGPSVILPFNHFLKEKITILFFTYVRTIASVQ